MTTEAMRKASQRPIGVVQRRVLDALLRHGGSWHIGCGWLWDTPTGTRRHMDSFVNRGLMTRAEREGPRGGTVIRYELTEAGWREARGDE